MFAYSNKNVAVVLRYCHKHTRCLSTEPPSKLRIQMKRHSAHRVLADTTHGSWERAHPYACGLQAIDHHVTTTEN